ncbi:hypothetical protein LZ198_01045 [Myxococcus sp. K15C18031901]|uniref:hypothetical protein n=1 Tax=Myxococcus dinghuensis TaxID=2906761 RepID=UPI0020A82388|nr:hypothetical protein [Myxococcus dinghuensis]MCP3097453.1 hypothetical protein [Myxococcus dinghuensis]
MFQATRHRVLAGVVLGTALSVLGGCSSTSKSSKAQVDESWLARVPEEQLGGVRDAQAERTRAQDAVTRADVAVKDAEREVTVAKQQSEAAKHSMEASKSAVEAAQATGRKPGIDEANSGLKHRETQYSAAQAEVQWRERAIETRKAEKQLRERELDLANARLRQAEMRTMKDSDDVRAKDLSESEFLAAVADAQRQTEEAQRAVDTRAREERDAHARFEKLRGYGGSGDSSND